MARWCQIRWSWWSSWSTIGKNVINRAGDLPMDDVRLQNLTGLETGGFWSLDCLKRLDCAVYKILVCRFPIYLFLLPFPQNSLLFYPNWPGDKLLDALSFFQWTGAFNAFCQIVPLTGLKFDGGFYFSKIVPPSSRCSKRPGCNVFIFSSCASAICRCGNTDAGEGNCLK